jgi:hypothetical protein
MGDRDEGSESIEQSANTWWKKKTSQKTRQQPIKN